ncbi:MAG: hypothetical protein AAF790_14295 [Planctomycetota bacterium]
MPAIDPRNIEVVDPAQAALFARATVAERVAMIGASNVTARAVIAGAIRSVQPEWDERRIAHAVAERMNCAAARPSSVGRPDA